MIRSYCYKSSNSFYPPDIMTENPRIVHGRLYKSILDDLTAKNIQWGVMLPMEHLEAIALKHANQQYEMSGAND